MKNILTIFTASFILLSLSFTFSSCKDCGKKGTNPAGRGGEASNTDGKAVDSGGGDTANNTNSDTKTSNGAADGNNKTPDGSNTTPNGTTDGSKPQPLTSSSDILALKQQIQYQLENMAAQLNVMQSADRDVTAVINLLGKANLETLKAEAKNAKGFIATAEKANIEAQKFVVTASQAEAAQANPEAMILVKAVELVALQVTEQVLLARHTLADIRMCELRPAADAAWKALGDVDQAWLKNQLQVGDEWSWWNDAPAENWSKVDQVALSPIDKEKIKEMKRSRQAWLDARGAQETTMREYNNNNAVKNLERRVGQAVLNKVKEAVAKATRQAQGAN
jgi:hypothetical protein